MATDGTASPQGKKDRREAARETARREREAEKRRERRNKIFLQGGIGAAILAIVIVIVLVVSGMNNTPKASASKVSPKNMATDGILFTGSNGTITPTTTPAVSVNASPKVTATDAPTDSGVAHIVTYVDWACSACKAFEGAYSADIASLVKSGQATLDVHPISILDPNYAPGSRYASRAANVAACVANFEPNKFLDVQNAFYVNQPAEGSAGLSNSGMKALVAGAGAQNASVTACIDNETFSAWVTKATTRATSNKALSNSDGGFGTPTVFVNGKRWNNSDDFLKFVEASTK